MYAYIVTLKAENMVRGKKDMWVDNNKMYLAILPLLDFTYQNHYTQHNGVQTVNS